jgi:enamine deaminase RidA (YjgF/YER057c/UK114 family)
VNRTPIQAADVLNEAYTYAFPAYKMPASFSRGLRVPLGETDMLIVSGTASIDETGCTIHAGDFRAQCWRTFRNIARLLESECATWHDIVRTSCYLRDIERDYDDFNEVRNQFYAWLDLSPLPASTGIQARLCRDDLLVEIEAYAFVPSKR